MMSSIKVIFIGLMICGASFQGVAQNYVLGFDGVDDQVEITTYVNMSPTEAVTVEAWLKGDSVSTIRFIYDRIEANDGYGLIVNPDGTAGFEVNGMAGVAYTSMSVLDGTWKHVAGTFDKDDGMLHIYVNGVLAGSAAYTSSITYDPEPRNSIGGTGGAGNRHFEGEIDEVRVWDVARTAQEILDNQCSVLDPVANPNLVAYWRMNEGTGTTVADLTANGNDGTFGGAPVWILDTICPTPTGISDVSTVAVKMYPNPMTNQVIVEIGETENYPSLLRMTNIAGQIVREVAIVPGEQIRLDRGQMPSGLYFIRLMAEDKLVYSEKLMLR